MFPANYWQIYNNTAGANLELRAYIPFQVHIHDNPEEEIVLRIDWRPNREDDHEITRNIRLRWRQRDNINGVRVETHGVQSRMEELLSTTTPDDGPDRPYLIMDGDYITFVRNGNDFRLVITQQPPTLAQLQAL